MIGPRFIFIKRGNQVIYPNYGLLYNYYVLTDARKISSSDIWLPLDITVSLALFSSAGGTSVCARTLKESGFDHWSATNNGTNNYNFNARGSAHRLANGSYSVFKNSYVFRIIASTQVLWQMSVNTSSIGGFNGYKEGGSLRLYRNASSAEQLLTDGTYVDDYIDNNGVHNRAIKMGVYILTADSLAERNFRNGDPIPFHGADNGINFTNAEWAALTTPGCCPVNGDWNNT